MLTLTASDLLTATLWSTPRLPSLRSLADLFEWMSPDSRSIHSSAMEKLFYLYDQALSIESRSTSVVFKVPEDFDFSLLRGVPFFYDRRTDANHNYFLHFHVSTLLALMFYEKYTCLKRS
ncbi:MAG: hypothetical protein [Microviridae sp.]|nr:MAG: hypothetical protein [Microviridae sp.]